MPIEDAREQWSAAVATVKVGATKAEGGSRGSVVTLGGERTLPFLHFEGETPNAPVVAMEVLDARPPDWPKALVDPFADVLDDPARWAARCERDYGAGMICVRLVGTHPDFGRRTPEQAAETVKAVLRAVSVPVMIWGCDVDDTDNLVLPKCCEAARGERCLVGTAKEDNYKTLTAACLADGHALIAESPLDINIAKQVNILCQDAGFPLSDIVIFPTTGALGYGIEYAYSIQERTRLAGLTSDKLLAPPILCDVGFEAWRAKEAKMPPFAAPPDGAADPPGAMWEAATAAVLMQAGAELLVMRHPKAVATIKSMIERLTQVPSN
jgi:acetyl-CoA decarbonylase/synthase complex subunit delta